MIEILASLVLFLFYSGCQISSLAAGLIVFTIVYLFWTGKPAWLKNFASRHPRLDSVGGWLLAGTIWMYPFYLGFIQWSRWQSGLQGVDFAMLAQILKQTADTNQTLSSLIDFRWQNFQTHHFSPYLYVLGYLNKIFEEPEILLILTHVVAVTASILAVARLLKLLGHSRQTIRLGVSLCILMPACRLALLWETHDEILALPFLLWAYLAFYRQQWARFYILLTIGLLFKETIWLSAACFAVLVLLQPVLFNRRNSIANILSAGGYFCFSLLGFLAYTKFLPGYLFWPTFDGFSRIASFQQFFDPGLLWRKIGFLLSVFIPVIFLLLAILPKQADRFRNFGRCFLLALPAAPFLGSIVLSKFVNMFTNSAYYIVVPALLCLQAAFLAAGLFKLKDADLRPIVLIALLVAACCGNRNQVFKEFKANADRAAEIPAIQKLISPDSVVIAGDLDAALFIRHKRIIRMFHANRSLPHFDYIVQSLPQNEPLSGYLRGWSKVCYAGERWQVRCALEKVRS